MKQSVNIPLILAAIIALNIVTAIGISPVRNIFNFEAAKTYDFNLIVRNDGQDIFLSFSASGELAPYIKFDEKEFTMSADTTEKIITAHLSLPTFLQPGNHKADITVLAQPKNKAAGDTTVSAAISLVSEVCVRVPLPGKYAEARSHINAKDNEVEFVVTVLNLGEKEISSTAGEISILEGTDEITVLNTDPVTLPPKQNTKLRAKWDQGVTPGIYFARTELTYDEKKIAMQDSFQVGKPDLNIQQMEIQDFTLGEIAILEITLSSDWNAPLQTSAEIEVEDAAGSIVSKFSTASITIPPRQTGLLKAYWDTAGIQPGAYKMNINLKFNEYSKLIALATQVDDNAITTDFTTPSKSKISWKVLLITLIALLIFGNFTFLGYIIIKRRKSQ